MYTNCVSRKTCDVILGVCCAIFVIAFSLIIAFGRGVMVIIAIIMLCASVLAGISGMYSCYRRCTDNPDFTYF